MAKKDKNQNQTPASGETQAAPAATKAEVASVTMTDGRVVDFPGKRKLQKESFIADDGTVSVRLDFRNGETRTISLRPDMLAKYAAHGAEQKLGDEIAGLKDDKGNDASIEDAVVVMDALIERLNAGEWTTKKDAGGLVGTSILAQAIVEVTGKPKEAIAAFLKTKTPAEKAALRASDKFRAKVLAELDAIG